MKIGLVPISGKPFHVGHQQLIQIAADECDAVVAFLSISSRGGDGDVLISGDAMKQVYQEYIEPLLRSMGNISVEYCGPGMAQPSPVRAVFRFLEAEEASGSQDEYAIYSGIDPADPTGGDDTAKYKAAVLAKSAPTIYQDGRINLRGVPRGGETTSISGTRMRALLATGDIQKFCELLPTGLSLQDKKNIFMILGGQQEVVREAVRQIMMTLLTERRLRETEITGGKKVQHGSRKHISDLKRRIRELEHWRLKEKRGSERRANYSRIINILKRELRSTQQAD